MNLLKNAKDVNMLLDIVNKCEGDVLLRRCDGSETFNLKSTLSMYIGIGKLAEEHGDEWEVFCMNRADERLFYPFFKEVHKDV